MAKPLGSRFYKVASFSTGRDGWHDPDPAYGGVYWADTRKIETQWFKEKIMARQDVHGAACNQGPFTVYR